VRERTQQGERQRSIVHCLIDPDLFHLLKIQAARERRTMRAVVEAAIAQYLATGEAQDAA
jgi:predicted transcriptional regulator